MADIDFMSEEDIPKAVELIAAVFDQFEAPEYPPEGIAEFLSYIREDQYRERMASGNHIELVAKIQGEIVGVIEVRNWDHICLLFVAPEYHQQGLGKELFSKAIDQCRESNETLAEITVNSSPYAELIYQKLGFEKVDEEQVVNGIRFIPMVLKIPS